MASPLSVIGLSGEIGAGKTTIADRVSRHLGMVRLAFGDLVRHELATRGTEVSRASLQACGEELINTLGYSGLALRLMQQAPDGVPVVVDGIRHLEVAAYYEERYGDRFLLLFLTAPFDVRLTRLRDRDPTCTACQLRQYENHSTESQLAALRSRAHLIVPTSAPLAECVEFILNRLSRSQP